MRTYWRKLSPAHQTIFSFFLILTFRAIFSLNVGLIDDEAYHWSWTKTMQLSYFDHPAMVAWLEKISIYFFGDTYLGVRLPGFIFYAGTVVFGWLLARDLFNEYSAHFFALNFLWSPFWGFGGYVASPEPYFVFFWILATWVFWQGMREDIYAWSIKKTWLSLGLIMGLGLNSKFIIVLLAPGFALYILLSKKHRKDLLTPWPWVGALIAVALCFPIFWWNHINEWPSFKYQFQSRHAHQPLSIQRWLEFIGTQLSLYTPVIFVLLCLTFIYSFLEKQQARWRLLFCISLPSILLFYTQPLKADYKPHWAGSALMILLTGTGYLIHEGLSFKKWTLIRPNSTKWKNGILIFLVPINLFIYTPFIYPWMPSAFHFLFPNKDWNTRYDLSNEFTGWEDVGQYLNRRQREIHSETNRRPFIAAHRYETTAQTYWGTQQEVFQLSKDISHYSVQQRMTGTSYLLGQDALFLMSEKYNDNPMDFARFDSCKKEEYKTYRYNIHARTFSIYYCRNFQGILR